MEMHTQQTAREMMYLYHTSLISIYCSRDDSDYEMRRLITTP